MPKSANQSALRQAFLIYKIMKDEVIKNENKQYTVMVETKEICKFCVVANSAKEAAEFICKVVANTDILHTDLSEESEVITQVAAYGTWSFINSGFNASSIGHGTKGQIAKCSRISWSSAQAGDLAFYGDLSHVGIVAGKDATGNILVIHCSSGNNNVVITTNSGFGFAARPRCY